MTEWYSNDIEHVIQSLESSPEGLSNAEADIRFNEYGPNELVETGGISPLRMFLQQFMDPMVIILLIAILISLLTTVLLSGGSDHDSGIESHSISP